MPGKSRFSKEQQIAILNEGQSGNIKELCRRHGITPMTYYRWKRKRRGGTEASQVDRARMARDENIRLSEENRQLRQVVADLILELKRRG